MCYLALERLNLIEISGEAVDDYTVGVAIQQDLLLDELHDDVLVGHFAGDDSLIDEGVRGRHRAEKSTDANVYPVRHILDGLSAKRRLVASWATCVNSQYF